MTELLILGGAAALLYFLDGKGGTMEQLQTNTVLVPLGSNTPWVQSVPFAYSDDYLNSHTEGSGEPPVENYEMELIERSLITTSQSPEMIQGLYAQQAADEERYWMTNSMPEMDIRHLL